MLHIYVWWSAAQFEKWAIWWTLLTKYHGFSTIRLTCIRKMDRPSHRWKTEELCRTRWVERHEAFQVFSDPIFCCFEAIPPTAWNRETRSDAHSFLLAMSQFSFIVALIYSQKVLGYTKGLSVKLQGLMLFGRTEISSQQLKVLDLEWTAFTLLRINKFSWSVKVLMLWKRSNIAQQVMFLNTTNTTNSTLRFQFLITWSMN